MDTNLFTQNKCLIKQKQHESSTNDLHDALLLIFLKDNHNFWKVWKSKFPNKKANKVLLVDGSSDPYIVANKFADYFSNLSTSEPLAYKSANNNLLERLSQYIGDSDKANINNVSIELLEELFESMSRGKAEGLDN